MKRGTKVKFSRRDFLKTGLLIPASSLLAACSQAEESLANVGPTRTPPGPTRSEVQLTNTLPPAGCDDHDRQGGPSVGHIAKAGDKLAEIRDPVEIRFVTIHHSEEARSADICELKEHATYYDSLHSVRDYNQDGVEDDAIPTSGELGYRWILYHYLVSDDGAILPLQDPKYVRFHATDNCRGENSHNRNGLAICLDGNFDEESPTEAQLLSAAQIIKDWQIEYGVKLQIKGHAEQAQFCDSPPHTSCPGLNIGLSSDGDSNLSRIIELANS